MASEGGKESEAMGVWTEFRSWGGHHAVGP